MSQPPSPQKVALFGLGSMGFGMACSLLRAGHRVYGFDIAAERVARLGEEGGSAGTLGDIAAADAVMPVVVNAAQTEAVLFGENDNQGAVPHMKPGAVVISCATVAPDFAKRMEAACQERGVSYLDAPISGGSLKAAEGRLAVLASGSADAFAAAAPILPAISERVFNMGAQAGAGSVMKAVNQLLCGVHLAAMAEAITFGMKQGLPPARFLEVVAKCAGSSWMLENRAPHIIAGDYTPRSSVNIWLKDLRIVLDIAEDKDFQAPITAAALRQFAAAAELGLGEEDDAAVAKLYARNSNQRLPGER